MRFGMKNNLRLLASTFLTILLSLNIASASALDIPLLSWEKGKIQSVVLGGGDTSNRWQVFLKSKDGEVTELSGSSANQNGFIVYSISVPRDLTTGAYSVITKGEGSPETVVAAVEIIEMQRYQITQIPGDLLFILLTLALWLCALGSLRGEKYRKINFYLSTGPKERYLLGEPSQEFIEHVYKFAPLEKLRILLHEQFPDSLFKYLLKSDSRGLHLKSPWIWAQLPGLSILSAAYLGYLSNQNTAGEFFTNNIALIILVVAIGSVDIFSGILAAVAFFAVRIWLLADFSLSAIFSTIVISQLFFLPALFIAFFSAVIAGKSKRPLFNSINRALFEWVSPALLIHFLFLIDRSISGAITQTFTSEILIISTILTGRIIHSVITPKTPRPENSKGVIEERDLKIGRLISPAFVAAVSLFVTVLLYLWISDGWQAILLGVLLSLPLLLLLARPTLPAMQVLSKLRREPLIEIVVVLAFVILIFEAITFFPVIASLSPALFISLGMAPVIIHSIIAFAADLGMKSELEEEAL
jgi:hypothetical protein